VYEKLFEMISFVRIRSRVEQIQVKSYCDAQVPRKFNTQGLI